MAATIESSFMEAHETEESATIEKGLPVVGHRGSHDSNHSDASEVVLSKDWTDSEEAKARTK